MSASLDSGPLFVATKQGLFSCDEARGACSATSIGSCEDVAADAHGKVHLVTRSAFVDDTQRAQTCDLQGNCVAISLGSERWEWPVAVAADAEGTAVIADAYHGLKRCTSDGNCSSLKFADHGTGVHLDVAFGHSGEVFVTDQSGLKGVGQCSSTGTCEDLAELGAFGYKGVQPYAVATSGGALFLGGQDSTGTFSVQRCLLSGQCEVLASGLAEIHGLSVSATGALYMSAGTSLMRCVEAGADIALV